MLDSNVHDLIAADAAVLDAIRKQVEDGRLVLISTHVQRDELMRTPEPKRTALMAIYGLAERISTTGAVWDVSRYDECTYGTDEVNSSLDALMAGNPKHAEDALIAATAAVAADAMVTNETRLASKVRRAGFAGDVWSWRQFVAWLES